MQFLKNLFNKGKDLATSGIIKRIANHYIKDYGEMLNFKIDSENNILSLEVLLKGEVSPISVELKDYEFIFEEGENYITFNDVSASREWIDVLVKTLIEKKGGRIPLENDQAKLLKLVL